MKSIRPFEVKSILIVLSKVLKFLSDTFHNMYIYCITNIAFNTTTNYCNAYLSIDLKKISNHQYSITYYLYAPCSP